MARVFNPPGGGGVDLPGALYITPATSVNYGNVVTGSPAALSFRIQNGGSGSAEVTNITAPGAEWALSGLPAFPATVAPGGSFSFTLALTPSGVGAKSTTVTVAWADAYGTETPITVAASGTGVAVGSGHWTPPAGSFPATQVNRTNDLVIAIQNAGAAGFNVTALNFTTGTYFSTVGAPGLPFAVGAGGSVNLTVRFAPTVVDSLTDTLTAVTDVAGSVALPLQGVCLLVIPIAVCADNERRILVGGYGAAGIASNPNPLLTSPDSWDSDQLGAIVFNGAIWQGLGVEKTLFRLGFYYENLGAATLTGTVSCFRPQVGADSSDSKSFSAALGTAAADGTTRYVEVDVVATGEILTLTLNRAASSGPVSLCGIVPYFEPRGEKVRGV